jgi:hypothetical protein
MKVGCAANTIEAEALWDYISEYGDLLSFDADVQGYDTSVSSNEIEGLGEFYQELYRNLADEGDETVDKACTMIKGLYNILKKPVLIDGTDMLQFEGGLPTGQAGTAYDNTIALILRYYYMWQEFVDTFDMIEKGIEGKGTIDTSCRLYEVLQKSIAKFVKKQWDIVFVPQNKHDWHRIITFLRMTLYLPAKGALLRTFACFASYCKLMGYGDDNIVSVKPLVSSFMNFYSVKLMFATMDIQLTTASKDEPEDYLFKPLKDTIFLGREWGEKNGRKVLSLRRSTFKKMLAYTKNPNCRQIFGTPEQLLKVDWDPEVIKSTMNSLQYELALVPTELQKEIMDHCTNQCKKNGIEYEYLGSPENIFNAVYYSDGLTAQWQL